MIVQEFVDRIPLFRALGAVGYKDLRPPDELTLDAFGIVLEDPWNYARRLR